MASGPGTEFTPLAASVLTDPTPVKGTDGQFHLAYEPLRTVVAITPTIAEGWSRSTASARQLEMPLDRNVIRF